MKAQHIKAVWRFGIWSRRTNPDENPEASRVGDAALAALLAPQPAGARRGHEQQRRPDPYIAIGETVILPTPPVYPY